MGRKLILIDFRKREEVAKLRNMVPQYCREMDAWIRNYKLSDDDPTPPTEEEAKVLEDAQIETLVAQFDKQAKTLARVQEGTLVTERRKLLLHNLQRRQGGLYAKFSKQVEALQLQAKACMEYCVETLQDFEVGLDNLLPTKPEDIQVIVQNLLDNCKTYIENSFPGGVAEMDVYDDVLPDGIPTYPEFVQQVQDKQETYLAQNQAAIPKAVERIKETSQQQFQSKINDAIQDALKEMEADLADDKLPYLDEASMTALREELLASARAYANSRLDE